MNELSLLGKNLSPNARVMLTFFILCNAIYLTKGEAWYYPEEEMSSRHHRLRTPPREGLYYNRESPAKYKKELKPQKTDAVEKLNYNQEPLSLDHISAQNAVELFKDENEIKEKQLRTILKLFKILRKKNLVNQVLSDYVSKEKIEQTSEYNGDETDDEELRRLNRNYYGWMDFGKRSDDFSY